LLLDWLLQFNPFFRCSASEAIKSSAFKDIRKKKTEFVASDKIKLDIDAEGAFDYQAGQSFKYNFDDYKSIILKEVEEVQ
jgi:hypothetical protein